MMMCLFLNMQMWLQQFPEMKRARDYLSVARFYPLFYMGMGFFVTFFASICYPMYDNISGTKVHNFP